MRLEGAVALVTGGGVRLGRAFTLALAESGCDVFVHYRASEAAAEAVADEARALGRRAATGAADLSDPAQIKRLLAAFDDRFDRLDVLVNSAAGFERLPLAETGAGEWDAVQALNLRAPFLLTRAAAVRMRASARARRAAAQPGRRGKPQAPGPAPLAPCAASGEPGAKRQGSKPEPRVPDAEPQVPGAVINVADMAGVAAWRGYVPHGVSKAGLLHLTAGAARELAPEVRVNAIVPGPILPPPGVEEEGASWRKLGARMPLARPGEPGEVGHAAVFLVENDYVTGETLFVNGGEHLLPGGR